MVYSVIQQRFDSLIASGADSGDPLRWSHVFVTPSFLKAWSRSFKPESDYRLMLVKENDAIIGAAPLAIDGDSASFIGDADVCDYLDFSIVPGKEREFYGVLIDDLIERGVNELDLRCLRPESTVSSCLNEMVRGRGGTFFEQPDGVSLEMELPSSWDEYLGMLNGKQRHEVRRKLRKLHDEAEVRFHVLEKANEIDRALGVFLKMFRESRSDKAVFMHAGMESYFRSMMLSMADEGLLRLFVLDVNKSAAAAAVCFEFRETMYLYNSAYDPDYSALSVGLLCKILSIRRGIECGLKKYDFLKGAEPYKSRLGGKEVHLSRCRIKLR